MITCPSLGLSTPINPSKSKGSGPSAIIDSWRLEACLLLLPSCLESPLKVIDKKNQIINNTF